MISTCLPSKMVPVAAMAARHRPPMICWRVAFLSRSFRFGVSESPLGLKGMPMITDAGLKCKDWLEI